MLRFEIICVGLLLNPLSLWHVITALDLFNLTPAQCDTDVCVCVVWVCVCTDICNDRWLSYLTAPKQTLCGHSFMGWSQSQRVISMCVCLCIRKRLWMQLCLFVWLGVRVFIYVCVNFCICVPPADCPTARMLHTHAVTNPSEIRITDNLKPHYHSPSQPMDVQEGEGPSESSQSSSFYFPFWESRLLIRKLTWCVSYTISFLRWIKKIITTLL